MLKIGPTVTEFEKELASAINKCSAENGSNTPDFILAKFLKGCLSAFDTASRSRERWYGKELRIGNQLVDLNDYGTPSERARHIAARVWCDQDMKSIVMDTEAAEHIAKVIDAVINCQCPPSHTPMTMKDLVTDP